MVKKKKKKKKEFRSAWIDSKPSTIHCPEEEPSLENPNTLDRNYSNTIFWS